MSVIVLPTRTDLAAYSMRVDLSETEYLLDFRFNDREGFWYLSLFDAGAAPVVESVKVVVGMPLFRSCVDARRPPGVLIAIDTSGADAEAGLSDLGDRVLLTYNDGVT